MRWQPNRLYRPSARSWSSLSWPVWVTLAAALIVWQVLAGGYIVGAAFVLLFAFVAVLRVRERRRG
jgi:hypothetical protein